MEWVGVVVIGLVDVVIPAGVAIWLVATNVRHHRSATSERTFWIIVGCALAPLGYLVTRSIIGVDDYDGSFVIPAGVLSIPGGLVPVVATVLLSGIFFDDASWATIGYFAVMPVFLGGLVVWQLVVVAGIRRLAQRDRLARAARSAGAPAAP